MSNATKMSGADFSRKAVRSHVKKAAVQQPAVLYPGVIGILGGLAALVLEPSLYAMSAAIGGFSVAGLAWVAGLSVFREHLASQYAQHLLEQVERQREERIGKTQTRLNLADSEQAQSQFKRLRDKFETFKQLLDGKLNPGELTHTRYLGMGEQLYLAVLDNLDHVADILQSLGAIDGEFIEQRLEQLEEDTQPDDVTSGEMTALKERETLFNNQNDRVAQLLAENEQAMTKLDTTLSAISDMTTGGQHASLDLETAMEELQRLAENAHAYSE